MATLPSTAAARRSNHSSAVFKSTVEFTMSKFKKLANLAASLNACLIFATELVSGKLSAITKPGYATYLVTRSAF